MRGQFLLWEVLVNYYNKNIISEVDRIQMLAEQQVKYNGLEVAVIVCHIDQHDMPLHIHFLFCK